MTNDIKKSLIALSAGTFGLGITEFAIMGILPYVADAFRVTIPEAGHLITAYALGVCVGAPLLLLIARKWPLKNAIFLIMGIYTLAGILSALCPAGQSWMSSMSPSNSCSNEPSGLA